MARFAAIALLLAVTASAQSISNEQKEEVGKALSQALNVLSGKAKAAGKSSTCASLFPSGKPEAGDSAAVWESCKDVVATGVKRAVLLSRRPNVGGITDSEKREIAKDLGDALATMSASPGTGSASKEESCRGLFPEGEPKDTSSPMWKSCKSVLFYGLIQTAQQVALHPAGRADLTAAVVKAAQALSWQ
eukprot:gnl/TRDRNA2_/TRDRNA2_193157_c0_seq1.p2 gnl/TRDRNA2_/TRDRNA2_193157_c0~~gnl/TRDRNA2_/TRDRNA2_193157_c0_seq1.p2  ORF type:complete len:190 (+),score=40.53 gnl/TRDRNA2_/TRDRNA2_193157_c0_seq1:66-635(+)